MLNSLQMMSHVSPLDLMAAAGHYHAAASSAVSSAAGRIYNSPPPISTSDPLANECKLIDYRGQKVAAFTISGEIMLCLPQAVEMFLKHAVGGPHTVYCKLKRLDIEPLVCNVEQVRILRALGAIQPFVNRCKLLSIKDFDILYGDCTTKTISKAGRPAKKILSMSPNDYSSQSQLKKYRLDNGDYGFDNENLSRLNKSHHQFPSSYNSHQLNHMALMQINQHHHHSSALLNNSTTNISTTSPSSQQQQHQQKLPRLDGSMMIKAAVQAGMSPGEIEAIARSGIWGHTAYEDMIKHLERYRLDDNGRSLAYDLKMKSTTDYNNSKLSPVLNLSKSNRSVEPSRSDCDLSEKSESLPPSDQDDLNENLSDFNVSDEADDEEDNISQSLSLISDNTSAKTHLDNANHNNNNNNFPSVKPVVVIPPIDEDLIQSDDPEFHNDGNLSVGTLLWNIQTLLKVAADNARQHEKQTTYEKAELKMDFMRERDVKDSLERQLVEERKLRVLYQKRYSRERKLGVRLKKRAEGKTKIHINKKEE